MAHHVETMSSQIVPLSNETTINDDETASSTMVNTICVIDMIILTVGCCLVTKAAVAIVAILLPCCCCLFLVDANADGSCCTGCTGFHVNICACDSMVGEVALL